MQMGKHELGKIDFELIDDAEKNAAHLFPRPRTDS